MRRVTFLPVLNGVNGIRSYNNVANQFETNRKLWVRTISCFHYSNDSLPVTITALMDRRDESLLSRDVRPIRTRINAHHLWRSGFHALSAILSTNKRSAAQSLKKKKMMTEKKKSSMRPQKQN